MDRGCEIKLTKRDMLGKKIFTRPRKDSVPASSY